MDMPNPEPSRRTAAAIGTADLITAALIAFGVFFALPARWWPVDTVACLLIAIELASGIGLLARARWGVAVARAAGAVALGIGLITVSLLAMTASWLSGIYGPVGLGGAMVLGFVAALLVPYLVVLPIAQLVSLQPNADAARPGSERA
jgi:hypothetical protein